MRERVVFRPTVTVREVGRGAQPHLPHLLPGREVRRRKCFKASTGYHIRQDIFLYKKKKTPSQSDITGPTSFYHKGPTNICQSTKGLSFGSEI